LQPLNQGPASVAQQNIRTVAELEQQFREQRTLPERIAERIGSFAGSIPFVLLHLFWFAAWVVANSGRVPGVAVFDPYPYILLALIVSCEGVLLSTFVLIKQNRMSKIAERRDHLNLQIDILAEQEITVTIRMLKTICRRLGILEIGDAAASSEFSAETKVDTLAEQVRHNMPAE